MYTDSDSNDGGADMQENHSEGFTYIRLHLASRALDTQARQVLEMLGVECLDDGGEYEAYGIVDANRSVLDLIKKLPGIDCIDLESPPSGK